MPFPYQESPAPAAATAANRVETVLFDYGLVLSGPEDPAAWAMMLAVTGLDDERLHEAYWKFRRDYDRGALTGRAYWHAVAADAGISFDDRQIAGLLAADVDLWTNLNLPMVEWARRLQYADVRTGILSNIGDCIAEGILARLPWLSAFYHCTWSYALLMAKPDPAIYVKAAEALRTAVANILFIDDRKENVEAAAAMGMQVIRYTGHAAFERGMRERGYGSLLDTGLSGVRPESADAPITRASALNPRVS
jgi:putative hydrolase of the HAD superfamily